LLEIRKKKRLAIKGHSLLKKKQDVLTNEFFEVVKEYKREKKNLLEKVKLSYKNLSMDIAYTGIYVSRSVAYATKPAFEIKLKNQNIMGLKLPVIETVKKPHEPNIFENSPLLYEAARNFKDLFQELIKISSLELRIKTLAEEIKKVKRRVNSLEHIQIPRLEQIEKEILFTLEEQERDNFIRLKTIKTKLNKRD